MSKASFGDIRAMAIPALPRARHINPKKNRPLDSTFFDTPDDEIKAVFERVRDGKATERDKDTFDAYWLLDFSRTVLSGGTVPPEYLKELASAFVQVLCGRPWALVFRVPGHCAPALGMSWFRNTIRMLSEGNISDAEFDKALDDEKNWRWKLRDHLSLEVYDFVAAAVRNGSTVEAALRKAPVGYSTARDAYYKWRRLREPTKYGELVEHPKRAGARARAKSPRKK